MAQRFVYVARLKAGDEVAVRRILEHLPDDALAASAVEEFSTFVGSGYCVLQFGLPDGDFQVQVERFLNDQRVQDFHRRLAEHLIEGQQIAQTFSAGNQRFHGGAKPAVVQGTGEHVTSAGMPLAAEVSHWPHE